MLFRFLFSLLLVGSLSVTASAQSGSNPCAELAKKHLSTLDKHLDLDYRQMKCLKEKAVTFCNKNRQNPPTSKAQREKRLAAFRKAILSCLDAKQRKKVVSHYRDQRDKKNRRNLLQAFMDEFGDEVIIIRKKKS